MARSRSLRRDGSSPRLRQSSVRRGGRPGLRGADRAARCQQAGEPELTKSTRDGWRRGSTYAPPRRCHLDDLEGNPGPGCCSCACSAGDARGLRLARRGSLRFPRASACRGSRSPDSVIGARSRERRLVRRPAAPRQRCRAASDISPQLGPAASPRGAGASRRGRGLLASPVSQAVLLPRNPGPGSGAISGGGFLGVRPRRSGRPSPRRACPLVNARDCKRGTVHARVVRHGAMSSLEVGQAITPAPWRCIATDPIT